jgi:hypothetical protein
MFKQFNRKHGRIRKSLMIPHNSQHVNRNKPCLSKGSSVYACNALSNVSLDGNILYLVGPWHPKPVMHKNKLRETKENNWGRDKICPFPNYVLSTVCWQGQVWEASITKSITKWETMLKYLIIPAIHVTSSICNTVTDF